MRFDRTAPGGGMVIYTKAENGKCLLEFQFFYEEKLKKQPVESGKQPIEQEKQPIEQGKQSVLGENEQFVPSENNSIVVEEMMSSREEYWIDIEVLDSCGEAVFRCHYPVKEEELARGLLLHPHLWNGLENPYLYRVSARLMCRESTEVTYPVDERKQILPLRSFRQMDRKGWYLNGKPFEMRGVLYSMAPENPDGVSALERAKTDLELIRQMGANTICLDEQVLDEAFISLCEEMGFVIWCMVQSRRGDKDCKEGMNATNEGRDYPKEMHAQRKASGKQLPRYSGDANGVGNVLTEGEQHLLTDFYYYYKACWSKEPFVHIVAKSLKRLENGNYSLTVYSNQKRVALYVDGVLFEFRVGSPEYVFEEIPGKKTPLLITVEAGECRKSMTFYSISN